MKSASRTKKVGSGILQGFNNYLPNLIGKLECNSFNFFWFERCMWESFQGLLVEACERENFLYCATALDVLCLISSSRSSFSEPSISSMSGTEEQLISFFLYSMFIYPVTNYLVSSKRSYARWKGALFAILFLATISVAHMVKSDG